MVNICPDVVGEGYRHGQFRRPVRDAGSEHRLEASESDSQGDKRAGRGGVKGAVTPPLRVADRIAEL